MHPMSPTQLLLIAIVVLVLFGKGKVASLMGEVGKGISSFKSAMKDGEAQAAAEAAAQQDPGPKAITDETSRL
ncbi:twin-arginine translocase TatA/TatE family subunit [Neotabrizicola shimadae]|uniref:Sec-independent protein translocase protein TatA n=1 Tax=Neotabrizicola shimadae TaxID=2807096 RepID=A0A8G1ECP2_9RHOB|nr:twin-arginine translocase TatA/TatE family subunit [Neotabrizicola shimadae]QYZ68579.1 twin-arginine translocase TatA/TatE family subunit [Neotabrizicola shimadae]